MRSQKFVFSSILILIEFKNCQWIFFSSSRTFIILCIPKELNESRDKTRDVTFTADSISPGPPAPYPKDPLLATILPGSLIPLRYREVTSFEQYQ